MLKISLRMAGAVVQQTQNQSIHQMARVDTIKEEVYGLTVLYRHIYALTGTILSHFSRPKVTLETIAKVNKLDAGTPSCTQPPKPFSIVSMQYSQH